jgi:ABC-type sugar transport system substrate-binding protein
VTPGKVHVYLSLCDAANPYQQLLKSDAVSAATRAGFSLETSFSHIGVVRQIQLLRGAVERPPGARPRAIMVLPVRDGTLDDVARDALRNDVTWVVLNRRGATLANLAAEARRIPAFAVSVDDREIGAIQARQLGVLLPGGGNAVLLRGSTSSATAVDREAGLRQNLDVKRYTLEVLDGGFSMDVAKRVVETRVRNSRALPSAVVCQNDDMALGAARALRSLALELGRPELAGIAVLGCDGLPAEGQRHVEEGTLYATVVVPSTTGAAIEQLSHVFGEGLRPPLEILLPAVAFPSDRVLRARTR